jgi:hypothetical protein
MKWLELTNEERKALGRTSVAEGRTLVERWVERPFDPRQRPSERARLAASLVPAGCRAVADIGCYSMRLESYLPAGIRYIPVDVARRDHRTVVVDLNVEPLPDLGADAVVALGVLEFLNDAAGLLGQVRCPAIVSYSPLDLKPNLDRAGAGWKNSYTVAGFSAMAEAAGFEIAALMPCPGKQMIWSLRRPAA